eukprot:CAMPEP_0174274696 /NCGR_PEP_ID=MMETSP0439-20130205/58917_1 /TAXON_ID=0 /ORGANISM="Stereomyxa ramosa, Strain Chinc5" /LENGTH=348 /DNA_ID=CAMNT_0015366633 /DNA_START=37 /DNA_END=1083 /DNA_ORIENTATION=+
MSESNVQVLLKKRPVGTPEPSIFEVVRSPKPVLAEGECLAKNVYLSLDPAMRGWMSSRKSYVPPVPLNSVMRGGTIAQIVESKSGRFKEGTMVMGTGGWQEYCVIPKNDNDWRPIPTGNFPLTWFLGVLGMTGLSAYFGLFKVGKPQPGETVLVSGGAGAVGSVVGQLAKIKGCRAVGIAGSDSKCEYLVKELGFDAAINYKTTKDLNADIRRTCPNGVDVYFDNVGGDTLNTALRRINLGARVVICGAISTYNDTEQAPGPSNYLSLLVFRARMEGFLIFDYADEFLTAIMEMINWIKEGKLKSSEKIIDGLENAPEALGLLFSGDKQGKLIVKIAGPTQTQHKASL